MAAVAVNLHTMTCQISSKILLKFFCLPTHTQESKFIFIFSIITDTNITTSTSEQGLCKFSEDA